MYSVVFTAKAEKELSKLDNPIKALIISWIKKNLQNCENPRLSGKALVGDKKGLWRYRAGDYRIIANIQDDKVIIEIITISHRKNVYKKKG